MRTTVIAFTTLLFFSGGAFAQDAASPPADAAAAGDATAPATTPDAAVPATTAAAQPADANAAPANPPMTGPRILIATSMGDITLQLDSVRAPKTVANILRYVREKHYDGTAVYRVAKGFVIEMGSWEAHKKGRASHKPIGLEADNGLSNLRGTAALAHGEDPDSGAADFFINISDNTALDHDKNDTQNKTGFAVFGAVTDGMDVVDRISGVPVGDDGPMAGQAPVDPILIKKVTILK